MEKDIRCIIENAINDREKIDKIEKAKDIDPDVEISDFIFKTNKYNKFEKLDGNREIDNNSVEKLKESVLKYGLQSTKPIIISKDRKILDGQTREEVGKELNIPIHFVIQDDISNYLEFVQTINSRQKNWSLENYVVSYMIEGNPNYLRFANLVIKEKIPMSLLIWLIYSSRNKVSQEKIKEGQLIFDEDDEIKVKKILNDIRELRDVIPDNLPEERKIRKSFLSDKVAVPLMVIMQESNYSKKRMINSIKRMYRSIDYRNMSTAGESLVEIYNFKLPRNSVNRIQSYNLISQKIR